MHQITNPKILIPTIFLIMLILFLGLFSTPILGESLSRQIFSHGSIRYSVVTPGSEKTGIMIYQYHPIELQLNLTKDLGVGWVRIDTIWRNIEKEGDNIYYQQNLDNLDALVFGCKQRGLKVMLLTTDTPSWAGDGIPQASRDDPPNPNYFVDWLSFLIERYHPEAMELWNEPHYQFSGTAQQLVNLYKRGHQIVKAIDPECITVIQFAGGGIGSNGMGLDGNKFSLKNLYILGIKDYYDVLSLHVYPGNLHPDQWGYWGNNEGLIWDLDYMHAFMAEQLNDSAKEIWVTEFGMSAGEDFLHPMWKQNNTLQEQADWLVATAEILLNSTLNITNIFQYSLYNPYVPQNNLIDYSGSNFNCRPAYFKYKDFIHNK